MIYIILTALLFSYAVNKYTYIICNEVPKSNKIKIFIYISIIMISILIYIKHNLTIESIKYISLLPFLVIISIIDYHTTDIYDITLLSGIIIQGIIFLLSINNGYNSLSYISGLLLGFIIPFLIAKITKGLGEGDIGLFSLCCFVLGHDYSIYLIYLSFILASIYCIYVILIKSGKIRKIAFAPFISLATVIIILTKFDLLNFYLNIINN